MDQIHYDYYYVQRSIQSRTRNYFNQYKYVGADGTKFYVTVGNVYLGYVVFNICYNVVALIISQLRYL